MKTINDYISAAKPKSARESVSPEFGLFYKEFFNWAVSSLRSMDREALGPIDFVAIYTATPHAETVTIGDVKYVVYDQYQGQVLNRLNRLYIENPSYEHVHAYLLKLSATYLLSSGYHQDACDRAMLFHTILESNTQVSSTWRSGGIDSAKEEFRRALVPAQELFAIGHEIMHAVLARQTLFAASIRSSFLRSHDDAVRMERFMTAQSDSARQQRVRNLARNDLRALFMKENGREPKPEELSSIELFVAYDSRADGGIFSDEAVRDSLVSNAHLLEECICDAYAMDLAARYLAQSEPAPNTAYIHPLMSAFVGLHHFRLIRHVRLLQSEQLLNLSGDETSRGRDQRFLDDFYDAQRRYMVGRKAVHALIFRHIDYGDISYAVPSPVDPANYPDMAEFWHYVHEVVSDINVRYAQSLGDQALFNFGDDSGQMLSRYKKTAAYKATCEYPLDSLESFVTTACNLPVSE